MLYLKSSDHSKARHAQNRRGDKDKNAAPDSLVRHKYAMPMIRNAFFILALLGSCAVLAQPSTMVPDSLQGISYDTLFKRIKNSGENPGTQKVYLKAYLDKARMEGNWKEIVQGYKNYLHRSRGETQITYADSMVLMAKKANDNDLIGSAYLTKGIVYYNFKKYKKALGQHLMADRYLVGTGDAYLKYKLKFNIALVKYYTEHYGEAMHLLNECREYFTGKSTAGYLNTLHLLGRCHSRMKNYGLSGDINKLGIAEGRRLGATGKEAYFIQTEGINNTMKGNYPLAVRQLDSTLKVIRRKKNDFANEVLGEFYLGRSYWGLGDRERAIGYFKKVDTSFIDQGYMKEELLGTYVFLTEYYTSLKNQELRFLYMKRHIEAINFMRSQDRYLNYKIKKEYDLKGIEREKQRVERLLWIKSKWKDIWMAVVVFLFILLAWGTYRYYRAKRIYRKRFDAIMEGDSPLLKKSRKGKRGPSQKPDIPQETIDRVLKQLERFEKDKGFLDKKMSAPKLMVILDINGKYLNRIMAYGKGKKVMEYINDLRVDYFIDRIKKEQKLALYNNRSLAGAAGFNSERTFTKAFKSRVGITPMFFIENLKKEEKQPL